MMSLTIECHLVIHIAKLNRELLPTEKSTNEQMSVSPESWIHRDINLKRWKK
jgi:hypothetical protein